MNEANPDQTARRAAGPDDRARWLVPALLVGLGLVVRAVAAWQTAVIFNDGPYYLLIASEAHAGDLAAALDHDLHPLYPLAIAMVAPLTGDLAAAGTLVSVVAGALGVLGLLSFLAHAFDRRVAAIGGFLYALHPYATRFASDVQSEGLYMALFLGAAGLAWRAWTEEDVLRGAAAGALAGGAYLVRPEGLGIAAAAVAFGALQLFRGRIPPSGFGRVGGALTLATFLVALPYLVYLHDATGEWELTRKKSVQDLVAPEGRVAPDPARGETDRRRFAPPPMRRPDARQASLLPARVSFEPRAVSAAVELGQVAIGAFHPILVVVFFLGLFRMRGSPGDRGIFVAFVIGLYAVVLYGLTLNVGYLDRRHVLAPLLILLGYAVLGLPVLGGWILRAVRPRMDIRGSPWPARLALVVVVVVTLPKTLGPYREDRLASRLAAEWLASRTDLRGPVSAEKHRTAWYAGEAFVHLARGGPAGDVDGLRRAGARFLIVDDAWIEARPDLQAGPTGLRELHRSEAAGHTARVYDLRPEAGATGATGAPGGAAEASH